MKSMIKVLSLSMLVIFVLTIMLSAVSFAEFDPGGVLENVETKAGEGAGNAEDTVWNIGAMVIYAVKLVGTILGVLLLGWFGLKWMTASAQGRAQLKEQTWNYVIGALLLFGAGPIAQMIYDAVTDNL